MSAYLQPERNEAIALDFDAWLQVEELTGRTAITTGMLDVPGGRAWWMRIGGDGGTPLLVLHGGPGSGHDGLLPLAALSDERPVIFYDQLGCGLSDAPDEPSLYTIQRAVEELTAIRTGLTLRQVNLFGHSWGSILAIEYLCQGRAAGVRKLVLSGALSSVPRFAAGTRQMLEQVRTKMAASSGAEPNDGELEKAFSEQHFCRVRPQPANVVRSRANLESSIAYRVMNGPNEYTVTGIIKDWDRTPDLHWIKVPTLVTTGEFDEVSADVIGALVGGLSNARVVTFGGCSHLVINEDPVAYLRTIRSFLQA